ncbi:MAG: HlyD family type I secretion periplasmic adaptor subunit [Defluviimonas sp.]|nr:HlyD family type I secretion periplasmic adaptor subunit [Defluviimonas sp.]
MTAAAPRTELGGRQWLMALAAPLVLAAIAGWAALTPIAGAVIASGSTTVAGENRRVQHLDGGIVETILVRNGDRVEAGQLLVRLDPTLLQGNLGIARSRLAEALALQARLRAEETGTSAAPLLDRAAALAEGAALLGGADGAVVAAALPRALDGQERILQARAAARRSQARQTLERVAQLRGQTAGLDGLIAAQEAQLGYIEEDLAAIRPLVGQGLAARTRLLEAERNRSALLGEMAQQRAERAGIANAVREAELEQARAEARFREEVATGLSEASARIEELVPQIVTYRAQFDRVDLRAPVAGVVHELAVATLGGVIAPGDTVMQIVPVNAGVTFEIRLDPRSVDAVHPGQRARLKFPGHALDGASQIEGRVASVSPATTEDPRSGASYYRVSVTAAADEIARLPLPPTPGLPRPTSRRTSTVHCAGW